MSNTIKGFRGADGPILLDFSGVGNVPGAVKSIAELTAQVGDIFEVESVDAESKVATVKAVAKPAGDGGTVPTKVSAFENDAGYVDEARVNELLAAFPTFEIQVVAELPDAGADKTIYLVPFADDSGSYLEYLYVNGAWEIIGSRSGENLSSADVSSIKTVLGNIMTIIKAQVEDDDGTPQGYNMDVSGLVTQNDTLIAALGSSGDTGGGDSGDTTEKTLTSISAVYSGGAVAVGTAVSALTGIVVTAHYSDGSSEAVSGYTLSGSIAEGENTVTVTYEGMTATFAVVGAAESGGEETPAFEATQSGSTLTIRGVADIASITQSGSTLTLT